MATPKLSGRKHAKSANSPNGKHRRTGSNAANKVYAQNPALRKKRDSIKKVKFGSNSNGMNGSGTDAEFEKIMGAVGNAHTQSYAQRRASRHSLKRKRNHSQLKDRNKDYNLSPAINMEVNESALNTVGLPKLNELQGMMKRVKSSPVVSPVQSRRGSDNLTGLVLLSEPSPDPQPLDSPFTLNNGGGTGTGMGGFGLPPPNDDDLDEMDETESFGRTGTLTESIIEDITVEQVQNRRKQSMRTPRTKGYSVSKSKQRWSQF